MTYNIMQFFKSRNRAGILQLRRRLTFWVSAAITADMDRCSLHDQQNFPTESM